LLSTTIRNRPENNLNVRLKLLCWDADITYDGYPADAGNRMTVDAMNSMILLTKACWLLFCAVWLAGWAYNLLRAPRVVRRDRRFGLTGLLGWIILLLAVIALQRLVPYAVWQALTFRDQDLADAGLAILVASTAFTLWARWALGTMWTGRPMIKEQHELRTEGPYAITRHPIYTGLTGMLLGTALIFGFGVLLPALIACFVYFAVKIQAEERLLTETFGERYREYRRRVPAIVPLLRGLPFDNDGEQHRRLPE
jgi:protein-S-isoprenylcysteine O-methyltransferase Ste14